MKLTKRQLKSLITELLEVQGPDQMIPAGDYTPSDPRAAELSRMRGPSAYDDAGIDMFDGFEKALVTVGEFLPGIDEVIDTTRAASAAYGMTQAYNDNDDSKFKSESQKFVVSAGFLMMPGVLEAFIKGAKKVLDAIDDELMIMGENVVKTILGGFLGVLKKLDDKSMLKKASPPKGTSKSTKNKAPKTKMTQTILDAPVPFDSRAAKKFQEITTNYGYYGDIIKRGSNGKLSKPEYFDGESIPRNIFKNTDLSKGSSDLYFRGIMKDSSGKVRVVVNDPKKSVTDGVDKFLPFDAVARLIKKDMSHSANDIYNPFKDGSKLGNYIAQQFLLHSDGYLDIDGIEKLGTFIRNLD
jgi:hypothetical protein